MRKPPAQERIVLEVSRAELVLINNAINEVCNGLHFDKGEFQTRLGESLEDARVLLQRIHALPVLDRPDR